MYIDENKNTGFGNIESHEFYGSNNFTSGNSNKLGSKGYHIISFSGINNSEGYYYVDGTAEDATNIQSLLNNGKFLGCTINNNQWLDNFCKILEVSYTENSKLCFKVDNFYSNMANGVNHVYSETKDYSNTAYNGAHPPLGKAVQDQSAYIFIVGYPEFGSFIFNDNAASFGKNNISQGDWTLTSGYGNIANGRYSASVGVDNKSGYATMSLGKNNDGSRALSGVLLGQDNKTDKYTLQPILIGKGLTSNYDNQVILGQYNKNKSDNILEIGNGKNTSNSSNVFEIKKDGSVYVNEKLFSTEETIETYSLNVSPLLEEGNYGDILDGRIYNNTSYGALSNTAEGHNLPIDPNTYYHKKLNSGIYFNYLQIKVDPRGTKRGLGLPPGKYIFSYDLDIKSNEYIDGLCVSNLYIDYNDKAMTAPDGGGTTNGKYKLKLGINHIVSKLEITEDTYQIGTYCTQYNAPTDSTCAFKMSNIRLMKLNEIDEVPSVQLAVTSSGHFYIGLINNISVQELSNLNYVGYSNYIASFDKSKYSLETLYKISNKDIIILDSFTTSTKEFVNEEVASLVDSAPETLNTLKELSMALGEDANFATTVNNKLSNIYTKEEVNAALQNASASAITWINDYDLESWDTLVRLTNNDTESHIGRYARISN